MSFLLAVAEPVCVAVSKAVLVDATPIGPGCGMTWAELGAPTVCERESQRATG